MSNQYYLDNSGIKDGPHDLVTIMRRIRAQKIGPDTPIYVGEADKPTPAGEIHDIALFFSRKLQNNEPAAAAVNIPSLSLHNILYEGWRFTTENSITTVFSGGMLLLAILISTGMVTALGPVIGSMLSWIIFVIFHYVFLACGLRLYRGQPFSVTFLNSQLAPALPHLIFAAIVFALMMIGGFSLLVLPALAVAIIYCFVPFFILDRNLTLIESMHASRLLVQKHNRKYQNKVAMLIFMHLGCLLLIIPVPVTFPMFIAGLAKLYEELSAS